MSNDDARTKLKDSRKHHDHRQSRNISKPAILSVSLFRLWLTAPWLRKSTQPIRPAEPPPDESPRGTTSQHGKRRSGINWSLSQYFYSEDVFPSPRQLEFVMSLIAKLHSGTFSAILSRKRFKSWKVEWGCVCVCKF
ncbi:hypothetical protein CDEST_15601 [Colletotrichum destructivum]|uniref:Uncharacterized protein n=1 Tax=Colletotrichum destructivum TaxID=34406 RepID=A0AAX4J5Q1_9PEZI|nr:hypothetical protein CDEST_15601 [Colletotrichum destructivum]